MNTNRVESLAFRSVSASSPALPSLVWSSRLNFGGLDRFQHMSSDSSEASVICVAWIGRVLNL